MNRSMINVSVMIEHTARISNGTPPCRSISRALLVCTCGAAASWPSDGNEDPASKNPRVVSAIIGAMKRLRLAVKDMATSVWETLQLSRESLINSRCEHGNSFAADANGSGLRRGLVFLGQRGFATQFHASLFVDAEHLDPNLIAHLQDIFHAFDPVIRDFADVQ